MTNPAPDLAIHVDFDITTVIGQDYEGGSITIADRVCEMLTERLLTQVRPDYLPPVREMVAEISNKLVEERFREVLDREFVPTDTYGAQKGEPTTIGELIMTTAQKWLTEKRGDNMSRGQGKSHLAYLIDESVNRAFESALRDTIKTAQAEILKVVGERASAVFAEVLGKAVKGI